MVKVIVIPRLLRRLIDHLLRGFHVALFDGVEVCAVGGGDGAGNLSPRNLRLTLCGFFVGEVGRECLLDDAVHLRVEAVGYRLLGLQIILDDVKPSFGKVERYGLLLNDHALAVLVHVIRGEVDQELVVIRVGAELLKLGDVAHLVAIREVLLCHLLGISLVLAVGCVVVELLRLGAVGLARFLHARVVVELADAVDARHELAEA